MSHSLSYGTSAIVRDGFESLPNVSVPAIYSLPTGKSQPSPVADTLLPLTQENTLSLNLALPSTLSHRACIYLRKCGHCYAEHPSVVSGLEDRIAPPHDQRGRYHCTQCNVDFRLKKDLQRHIETMEIHRSAIFQCCCRHRSGRKDNFLKHIKRKKSCRPTVPFICSCGYKIETNSPDAITQLLKHIKPCGQRKRGQPKK